jgi:hypothetical protein
VEGVGSAESHLECSNKFVYYYRCATFRAAAVLHARGRQTCAANVLVALV